MDDLLLHSTKVAHWKLEQLFQSMCKNGLKLIPRSVNYLELNLPVWAMNLSSTKEP